MPDPVSRNIIRQAIRKLHDHQINGEQALFLLCAYVGKKGINRTPDCDVFNNFPDFFEDTFKNVDFARTIMNADVLGWIYEIYIQYGMRNYSKEYGQYFTNADICKEMVALCDPKEDESICDTAMGTGGMLISYVQYMLKKKHRRGRIDGFDIDPLVVKLGKMNFNMYIPSTDFNIRCQDSLLEGLPCKYDIITTNVPFGVKKYDYDACCKTIQRTRIHCADTVPLFIQLIINSLNEKGRAAVIVPEVFLLSQSKQHRHTRIFLLKTTTISKIIRLSGKFFMNTRCQPYILFFSKPATGADPRSEYQIEFSEINKESDNSISRKTIGAVMTSDIDTTTYSLHPMTNLSDHFQKAPMIRLGDNNTQPIRKVCYISKGKRLMDTGQLFPYIDISGEPKRYVDECTCMDPVILTPSVCNIGKIFFVEKPCHPSDNLIVIQPINTNVLDVRYMYYYSIFRIKPILVASAHGLKPMIGMDVFDHIRVHVPCVASQRDVVNIIEDVLKTYTIEEIEAFSTNWIEAILNGHVGRLRNSFILYQQTIILRKCISNYMNSLVYTDEASDTIRDGPLIALSDLVLLNPETAKETEEITYIDISSVKNGIILKTQKLVWELRPKRASRKIRVGDIIFSTLRPKSHTHAYISSLEDDHTIVSSGFAVLRCVKPDLIVPQYLYRCLTSDEFITYLEKFCFGSYSSFCPKVILDYKIVVPSISYQKDFLKNIRTLRQSDNYFSDILSIAKVIKSTK